MNKYIKELWEWFSRRAIGYSKKEKREMFVDGLIKYYVKTKHPELTEKEIDDLQKLSKAFVEISVLIIKSKEETAKEMKNELIKLSEKYKL